MKKVLVGALFCILACTVSAQVKADDLNLDAADPALIGSDSAQQKLKEISIEKFENEGTWVTAMSADEGFIQGRLFDGSPVGKKPIEAEKDLNIADDKVYGAKVEFFKRGYSSFTIRAVKPLPVEGISKTLSVWVVGRNYRHTIKLLLEDYWGNQFELYMGRLNHSGWKLMTVAIPSQNPNGTSGIVQKDYHYGSNMGIKVVGFRVECDPEDAYGSYFIYFDDMRVISDLYEMEARDSDDMYDNW